MVQLVVVFLLVDLRTATTSLVVTWFRWWTLSLIVWTRLSYRQTLAQTCGGQPAVSLLQILGVRA